MGTLTVRELITQLSSLDDLDQVVGAACCVGGSPHPVTGTYAGVRGATVAIDDERSVDDDPEDDEPEDPEHEFIGLGFDVRMTTPPIFDVTRPWPVDDDPSADDRVLTIEGD